MEFFNNYFKKVNQSLENLDKKQLKKIADILFRAWKDERQIFIIGNGGSGANASHFTGDLVKGLSAEGKKRFKAMCFCDNFSSFAAIANDISYDDIFVEQLKNFAQEGDMLIGLSGSGNSKNVLKAMVWANNNSTITIGLTGMGGGKLKQLAKYPLIVPSENMERIEDIHLVILHAVKMYLKELIDKEE